MPAVFVWSFFALVFPGRVRLGRRYFFWSFLPFFVASLFLMCPRFLLAVWGGDRNGWLDSPCSLEIRPVPANDEQSFDLKRASATLLHIQFQLKVLVQLI